MSFILEALAFNIIIIGVSYRIAKVAFLVN